MKVNTRNNCWSNRVCCIRGGYLLFFKTATTALALFTAIFLFAVAQVQAQTGAQTRICVVVPHFKDEYWLSVGYGLQEEAKAAGATLLFFESGGYSALQSQIALLETCRARGAEAILLGAVSADAPALLAAVESTSQSVPVLALVNALHSDHLVAEIGVDWQQMGIAVGQYLAGMHPEGTPPVRVGFVTGPEDSGWSPLLEAGLQSALAHSAVTIAITRHADTGLREQLREVERLLAAEPTLDYLIGSAPAIEGAMGLAARSNNAFPQMIATYISHSVRRGLQSGAVMAVPFDDPVLQGRLGVRAVIRAIQGEHQLIMEAPPIRLVEAGTSESRSLPLSPAHLLLDLE